ncbi:relaxase/mobilization nuclease domain-containing protein [Campylobacter concisus]|uniref:relaxase/mobilization nuclease domain-containing protein n=1 Tax=Campylobacter concisus TaxID=199 RepID=UPI00122D0EC0|nr:relaxase/mobilization nuclease domain-containing protein [Campylobacter concisus]
MLIKFFKTNSGGGESGIDYLLNSRVADKTAYVIKGNEHVTRQIINNIENRQKTCIGCLSFEEDNIDQNVKKELIREFERILFGMYRERFNILWVEHIDKGRLELNFVIPKIDLKSGLAFNPYYHKADMPLIDSWQNYTNLRYNFSDPKDPAKSHILQGQRKELSLIKDYIEFERILIDKFINQEFTCRSDILKAFNDSNIEITRVGEDYVSVKLPNSKKARRFKGDMFNEKFTSIEAMEQLRSKADARAAEFKDTRDLSRNENDARVVSKREKELDRLKAACIKQVQKRDRWLKSQAEREPKQNKGFQNHIIDTIGDNNSYNNIVDKNKNRDIVFRKREQRDESLYRKIYKWRQLKNKITIFDKRIDNDTIRANIINRIRRKREARERENGTFMSIVTSVQCIVKQVESIISGIKNIRIRVAGLRSLYAKTERGIDEIVARRRNIINQYNQKSQSQYQISQKTENKIPQKTAEIDFL